MSSNYYQPPLEPDRRRSGMPWWAIVLLVLGGFVVLLVLGFVLVLGLIAFTCSTH
ncbi:MAG: hypothetical protein U0271_18845 [Polyangiaceae bacterium]